MKIIETSIFTQQVINILTEDEYRELQNTLIRHPEQGDLIRGSGGLRKILWHVSGSGKRGGS